MKFLIILRDDPSESCSPEFSSVASLAVQILVRALIDRGQVELPGAGGALGTPLVVGAATRVKLLVGINSAVTAGTDSLPPI